MTHNSRCKYCGRGSLKWMQVAGKWKLVDINDVPHSCQSMINAKITEAKKRKQYE